jgi:PAS domain S-box-containing protein
MHVPGIARPLGYGLLIVGIFALDAVSPLGLNVPILYLLPLLMAFILEGVQRRVVLTILASVLTAAVVPWKWSDTWLPGTINRCLDMGVFWVALALSIRDARRIGELRDLRYALDKASIVAVTDANGVIRHVNDRFCEMTKYSREELIGCTHCLVNSGTHSKAFMHDLWQTVSAGRIWHGEIRNRAKDGSVYWVDTTIVPFVREHEKPYQYLAIYSDISARKRAEAGLRNQAALAKVGEMVAIVAHEVRNPLAGIRAGLQMLAHRPSLEKSDRDTMGQMVDRLDLLNAHVTDLLHFAKPRSPHMRPVDVRDMLEKIGRLLFQDGLSADVRCQIDGPGVHALGDAGMLHEIFTNLLLNASQAIEGRGTIGVTIAATDAVDVLISDSGRGIPPSLHGRIFEPFFTTKSNGTGLGLAIVKQLVELHGGEIEIVASDASGSTIRVRLPRAEDALINGTSAAWESRGADPTDPASVRIARESRPEAAATM